MATQQYVDSVTLTSAVEFNRFDSVTYMYMTGVAGTNTVTATGPANMVLTAPQAPVILVPAATNTGATTLNITPSGGVALTAKAVFCNGIACVGGELRAGVPAILVYDGTQYQIVGPFTGGTLAAPVVGTDATDATSITTGAFKTAGGLGVAKALWVGGLANVAGAVTLQSTLAVTGAATLSSTLALGSSGMTVTGSATSWGFGVAPSPWSLGKAIEVGTVGSGIWNVSAINSWFTNNYYYNGADKFAGTGYAAGYNITNGVHGWYTSSASGTAGNTATMNTLMTLSAAGGLSGTQTSNNECYTWHTSNSVPYGIFLDYTGAAPNGTGNNFYDFRDTGGQRIAARSNGGIANYSANNVNLSDETVKSDFVAMPSFRDEFAAMHGKWTRFKYTDQSHSDYNSGYRAQDIKEVFGAKAPELVDWWATEKRIEVEDAETGEKTNTRVPIPESERKLAVYNDDLHNIAMSVLSELVIEQNILRSKFDAYVAAHP